LPELPEVETIVRDLRERLIGRRIVAVEVFDPRVVAPGEPAAFVAGLTGRQVATIDRRGKYILITLDDARSLLTHLRMTGSLIEQPFAPPDADVPKHVRLSLRFDNGRQLLFRDPRRFGTFILIEPAGRAALDARLGPEPLSEAFDATALAQRIGKRAAPIKSLLLNQALLAGLGNIYADEALFAASLRPTRPANSLTPAEITRLTGAIRDVLARAVACRGTTLDDDAFHDLDGKTGQYQEVVQVYRRTGKPCRRCGTPVERVKIAGRSSHFCPVCQV